MPLTHWRQLSRRRLQAYPSPLSPTNSLLADSLPAWLSNPIIPRLLDISLGPSNEENIFGNAPHLAPNHCLINEYLPGQGIHPHEDGDAYYPLVATVSLGSHVVLDVKPKAGDGVCSGWRILQEPRSLLITTGALYTQYLHGIGDAEVDRNLGRRSIANWDLLGAPEDYVRTQAPRERRISLTFRDVKRVRKLGKAFSGLVQR